ncbi:2-dehydropantoate 2-reductase [bacterium BFN5]|nr:2-dehydropantoate 2-reductase [bacterium BFN5]QJW48925.1 2-dehydropantoate 2-reductase [bacterium BFN5]
MRTAVLGAGALGIIIGALIAKGGYPIDLIDSYKENVDALNANGATVTGFLELNVPVRAFTPGQLEGCYDLVLLLTKQTHNEIALNQILPHLHKDSIVCTLQNGIPEESVAAYVGKDRTIGGAVMFGATWEKPGVSRLASPYENTRKYAFTVGEMDGALRPRMQQVKEILETVGKTEILTNLMEVRWTKLLMNATFSGMAAALNCTFGDVLASPKAMKCVAHIADETVKVCHAQGYHMVEVLGESFEQFELKSDADIPKKIQLFRKLWDNQGAQKGSMIQDLEKGRKTEVDCINGVVCQKGRKASIATPYNDKIVELIKEEEKTGKLHDFSFLERFDKIPQLAEV